MAKQKMNSWDMASWILCTLAAVVLGVVGAFNYSVVDSLFGAGSVITRTIYVIIGLGGLYSLHHMFTCRKK